MNSIIESEQFIKINRRTEKIEKLVGLRTARLSLRNFVFLNYLPF